MSDTLQQTSTKTSLPHYNVFAGSNIGYIKGVCFHKKTYHNLNTVGDNGKPSRGMGISCMCWGKSDESSMYCGKLDGGIIYHDLTRNTFDLLNLTRETGDGQLKAIKVCEKNLISAFSNGVIKIFALENTSSDIDPSSVIITYSEGENKHLQCMDLNQFIPNTIVTGGNENSLKVWDITASETPVFAAKNVKNDWLNLRVPVWVTKAQFYPDSNKIVCGTGYGDVRLYDPSSSQKRPVIEVKCGEHPLTGFCVRPNSDYQIYVGDTTGLIASIDLRKKATLKSFKGCKGGVTDIVAHPKYPVFTVSSVDRFVYSYDPDHSRNVINSVYLKNSINCLLCSSSWQQEDYGHVLSKDNVGFSSSELKESSEEVDSESDSCTEKEDIWDTMEVVGNKKRIKVEEIEASRPKAPKNDNL